MNNLIVFIRNSELIRGFFSSTFWGGVSKLIAVLVTMYCSNTLTQEGFGEFSFIRNTLNMVLVICATNFSTLAVKFAAESISSKDSLKKLFLLFEFTLLVSVFVGIVTILIPFDILQSFTGGRSVAFFMKIVGLCLPVFIIQPLISAIFRGYKQFNIVGIYETANILLYFGLIVIGIYLFDYKGAIWALLLYCFLFSTSGLVLLAVYNRKTHYIVKIDNLREQKQSIYKMILPIFVMSFVEAPLIWVAQAEIGRRASYAFVGILSVILTIRYIIQIVPTYFYQSFIPHVTILNSEHKYDAYFKKFYQVSRMLVFISLLLIPVLLLFGKVLLSIFDKSYVDSYDVFALSVFIIPLLLFSTLYKLNMMIKEHQVSMLYMTIVSSIVFLLSFYYFASVCENILDAFFYAQAMQFFIQLIYSLKIFVSDKRMCLSV
jgi:O-antigen/teichoic acid export membrane protein